MLQRVGAGLVAIQASTDMRPPDPDGVNPWATHVGALGSEGAAKDLLVKLDSMQAQVSLLLTNLVPMYVKTIKKKKMKKNLWASMFCILLL